MLNRWGFSAVFPERHSALADADAGGALFLGKTMRQPGRADGLW